MAAKDDDDVATGQALIRELARVADPVEQGEVLSEVRDCHDRLLDEGRDEDILGLLDQLLAWQLDGEVVEDEDSVRSAHEIAATMLARAGALHALDRFAEVVVQCDDFLRMCGQEETLSASLQTDRAAVLYWKGDSLLRLKRWLEALAAFDEVVAGEQLIPEDGRHWVADAREGRGQALEGMGDDDGAADAYSGAIAALADVDDPNVLTVLERLMSSEAAVLARVGRVDEAIAGCDALIERSEPIELARVAVAYLQKAAYLALLGDFDAVIEILDTVFRRFSTSEELRIRHCVAVSLTMKIQTLEALGRKDAAALTAEQLVQRYGADLDPDIERTVAPYAHRLGRGRSRLRFPGLG
jgi:tetratricopeptide (TPR) repeat protein